MTGVDQGIAFALTLAVEIPVVMAATAHLPIGRGRRWAAAVLPSCFTHPFAWRLMGNYGAHDYTAGFYLVEGIVLLVEALCLRMVLKLPLPRSLLLSFVANAASAALGWVIL